VKVSPGRFVALLGGIVLVLLFASSAQAIIQVQRGISGIRLNMSPARVKASLGTPSHVKHGSNPFGSFTQYRYKGGITVTFQGNEKVTAVSISGPSDRTRTGVGVGSTEQQVKDGVPGVKCQGGNHPGGAQSCHVGSFKAGHKLTDFLLRHGRVSRVTVGFVID
jgi:hypothetical protein